MVGGYAGHEIGEEVGKDEFFVVVVNMMHLLEMIAVPPRRMEAGFAWLQRPPPSNLSKPSWKAG